MAKILKCPRCQEKIDVTDLSGGSTVRCEACGTMVRLASGATAKIPVAAPAPAPAAPAKTKERTTKVRAAPGRQTDLFRKMSNARAPGDKGRPRSPGEKAAGGTNPTTMIAIAAAAIVVLGGVAFAVLSKKEAPSSRSSSGEGRDKESSQ